MGGPEAAGRGEGVNSPGDYDDVPMGGIAPPFYEAYVPVEMQRRLIAAFPELRMVYNAKTKKLNCVHRQPGWRESFYGTTGLGVLGGWSLIPGEYQLGTSIDEIINQLRAREYAAVTVCKMQGYENLAEKVDAIYDKMVADAAAKESEMMDEYLGLRPDGTVSPFGIGSDAIVSRPYSTKFQTYDKPLVVVPKHLIGNGPIFHVRGKKPKVGAK